MSHQFSNIFAGKISRHRTSTQVLPHLLFVVAVWSYPAASAGRALRTAASDGALQVAVWDPPSLNLRNPVRIVTRVPISYPIILFQSPSTPLKFSHIAMRKIHQQSWYFSGMIQVCSLLQCFRLVQAGILKGFRWSQVVISLAGRPQGLPGLWVARLLCYCYFW